MSSHKALQLHFWQRRLLVASQILQPLDGNPCRERGKGRKWCSGTYHGRFEFWNSLRMPWQTYGNPSVCTMSLALCILVGVALIVQFRSNHVWFRASIASIQHVCSQPSTLFQCVPYVSLSTSATVVWSSFRQPAQKQYQSISISINDDQRWINILMNKTIIWQDAVIDL